MKNDILKTATSISFPDVDLENVKGVLIDLDNTLYLYTPPHEKAMYATWRFFNRFYPMSKEEFETDFAKVWDDIFEQMGNVPSAHHRMTIFQRFAEEKGLDKPYQIATKANELYFKTVFKYMKKYGPDKKAVAFLKECKKKNLPVCLVTDLFASIQTKKLEALKLTPYIDFIVANDEACEDKPSAKMFQIACRKLCLMPEEVIMIGDNLKKDVQGAENAGIKAYHVILNK